MSQQPTRNRDKPHTVKVVKPNLTTNREKQLSDSALQTLCSDPAARSFTVLLALWASRAGLPPRCPSGNHKSCHNTEGNSVSGRPSLAGLMRKSN